MNGMVDPNCRNLTAIHDVIDPIPSDPATFRIDPCGPLPLDLTEDTDTILQEDLDCSLNDSDLQEFSDLFDPLCMYDDYGVSLYMAA